MPDGEHRLVLVVDDEPRLAKFVRMNLEVEGFRVEEARSGLQALDKARDLLPDVVILDVAMPEMDGFETLRYLRQTSTVPVIMLTVRSDEDDRIRGLELGADDYVTKPFSPRELTTRVKALIRRATMPPLTEKTETRIDDRLTIDLKRQEVVVDGRSVKLRPTEYRLLYHLVSNAGWLMTHQMLLSRVWGHEYIDDTQLLRLYVNYLRQKIEPDPANPRYILTEHGSGYRFVDFRRAAGNEAPPDFGTPPADRGLA
jgi:two-component system, OmpR family, KDP operon response regulator KdpE